MDLNFLKGNKFKALYEDEKAKFDDLLNEYKKLQEKQLSVEQLDLMELNNKLAERQKEYDDLELKCKNLDDEINNLSSELETKKSEIIAADDVLYFQDFGLYVPRYEFATSFEYKTKLDEIRNKQKQLIKDKLAVNIESNFTYNNSLAKGKQLLEKQSKLMLRSFNTECEAAIYKVRFSNLQTIENRIRRSFEAINKLSGFALCTITSQYLNLKIEELYLAYEYEVKKEEEREILREQREKEREEKALLKEINDKKKVIDKEITHLNNALTKLNEKLLNSTDEDKNNLLEEIEKIKNQIDDYNKEKEELDYRVVHASAGYVYIISNVGSFGDDVVKIGVTRRLDPMERIIELSSASVPFKFDVHALIFSYEAYDLENYLHKRFDKNRINLVNNRKEFFKIDIAEIKKVLEEEFNNLTFEFHDKPEAEEYSQTLAIRKGDVQ